METEKRIKYNRFTKDFDAYLNEEFIGSFRTYHDAENELDRLALAQITRVAKEPTNDPR